MQLLKALISCFFHRKNNLNQSILKNIWNIEDQPNWKIMIINFYCRKQIDIQWSLSRRKREEPLLGSRPTLKDFAKCLLLRQILILETFQTKYLQ